MTLGLAFAWLVGFLVTVGVILWKAMQQSRSWNDLTAPPGSVERDLRWPSIEDGGDSVGGHLDQVVGRGSEGHGPNVADEPSAEAPSVPPDAA
jgi:hypothetical protein